MLRLLTLVLQEVGYDSGKKIKGRKRHILVEKLGLLIVVVITAANISELADVKRVFSKLDQICDCLWHCPLGNRFRRLITIWIDDGYRDNTI